MWQSFYRLKSRTARRDRNGLSFPEAREELVELASRLIYVQQMAKTRLTDVQTGRQAGSHYLLLVLNAAPSLGASRPRLRQQQVARRAILNPPSTPRMIAMCPCQMRSRLKSHAGTSMSPHPHLSVAAAHGREIHILADRYTQSGVLPFKRKLLGPARQLRFKRRQHVFLVVVCDSRMRRICLGRVRTLNINDLRQENNFLHPESAKSG